MNVTIHLLHAPVMLLTFDLTQQNQIFFFHSRDSGALLNSEGFLGIFCIHDTQQEDRTSHTIFSPFIE